MDISNRTLAWLVIAAIAVSILGTGISLWNLGNRDNAFLGYATSNASGEARVDVSQSVILRFIQNATDFGSGSVDSTAGWKCALSINDSTTIYKLGCTNFNTTTTFLTLENAGTSNLNVTLNFTENATDFMPSSNAAGLSLKFVVSDAEANSCQNKNATTYAWTEVGPSNITNTYICYNLSWSTASNLLKIGLNLTITDNVTQGSRYMVIQAQGTNIA